MKELHGISIVAGIIALIIVAGSLAVAAEEPKGPAVMVPAQGAVSFEGMTSTRFKNLADDTKFSMGKRTLTKRDITAIFEQAGKRHQTEATTKRSRLMSEMKTKQARLREELKRQTDSKNAQVLAEFRRFKPALSSQPKAGDTDVPTITEVHGTATPGMYLMIKGTALGSDTGQVIIKASAFPGGKLDLVVDQGWSQTSTAARIVFPGGGMKKTPSELQIIRKDGKTSNSYKIMFSPEKEFDTIELGDTTWSSMNCSDAAWKNNCDPSGVAVSHFAFPDGTTYTGKDSYSIGLKNEWKLTGKSCAYTGQTQPKFSSIPLGEDFLVQQIEWTIPTSFIYEISAESLMAYGMTANCVFEIEGPKGVSWK